MNTICPNCGQTTSVRVHGHDQCARCGFVDSPCCNGDCGILGGVVPAKPEAPGALWQARMVVAGTLALACAMLASGCTSNSKPGATSTDRSAAATATDRNQHATPPVGPATRPVVVTAIDPAITPQQSYAKGVTFLIDNQNEDGSWGTFVSLRTGEIYLDNLSSHHAFHDATTALCLMALLEPSKTDPAAFKAVERGLAYVLASKPAGRASGGTFYDTWTHTYMTQCLARCMKDERFAAQRDKIAEIGQREIALLGERQMLEGGFGYYDFNYTLKSPSGDESTSFNAAAALVALYEAKNANLKVPPEMIAGALGAVQRLRLPSGAYVYGEYARNNPSAGYNKVKGSLGRSQSCNLALWLFKDQIKQPITLDDLRKSAEVMRDEHHFIEIGRGRPVPHEAWYFTAGYYYLFGHYYLSRVLNELTTTDRENLRKWLIDNMVAIQDPGGSWTDFPLYGYHRCYGAAFGLLTLQECGIAAQ